MIRYDSQVLPAVKVRGSRTLKTTPRASSAAILDPLQSDPDPAPLLALLLGVKGPRHRRWRLGGAWGRRHAPVPCSRTERQADAEGLTTSSVCPSVCLSVGPTAELTCFQKQKIPKIRKVRGFFLPFFFSSFFLFSSSDFLLSEKQRPTRTPTSDRSERSAQAPPTR